jgi:hypothetical protein
MSKTARFKVTAAEDGLVIWPAETELQPDRDGTYFDPDCKARGDVCGYDMHLILAGLVDASRGIKDGIYEIEASLVSVTPKKG